MLVLGVVAQRPLHHWGAGVVAVLVQKEPLHRWGAVGVAVLVLLQPLHHWGVVGVVVAAAVGAVQLPYARRRMVRRLAVVP